MCLNKGFLSLFGEHRYQNGDRVQVCVQQHADLSPTKRPLDSKAGCSSVVDTVSCTTRIRALFV